MTHPEHDPGPVLDDETDDGAAGALAALEAGNYAEAVKGYKPPADHATQPDQVDPAPKLATKSADPTAEVAQ